MFQPTKYRYSLEHRGLSFIFSVCRY